MLKLLLISTGLAVACTVLYMLGVALFYFSKDKSVFSGGSWVFGLLLQYVGFYVSLLGVIILTATHFSSQDTDSFGFPYYLMLGVVLINILAVLLLYIQDTQKYPNNYKTLSLYVGDIPTGVTVLLLDITKK